MKTGNGDRRRRAPFTGSILTVSLLIVSVVAFGAAYAQSDEQGDGADGIEMEHSIETLVGLKVNDRVIKFTVVGTGCTDKSSFHVLSHGDRDKRILLVRLMRDACKARAEEVSIKFSRDELGLENFDTIAVLNPIAVGFLPL